MSPTLEFIARIADLEAENARLQEREIVAQRLLNFTPDQLELLTDPKKLAYVEWNMSSTYTLQLMCKTYREGKMEVRRYKALAEWRKGALEIAAADAHVLAFLRPDDFPGHSKEFMGCQHFTCVKARAAIAAEALEEKR